VHEAVKNFGVGAEISACINENLFGQLKTKVVRLGSRQCSVPFSKPLETAFRPGEADIEAAIRSVLQ
jgi:acetoin:2,6-dichlorophenolindophenol oxidoreductase subunit beta